MKDKGVKRDKSKSPAEMMLHKIQGMVDAFNSMYGKNDSCRLDLLTVKDHKIEKAKLYNYSQQYNLDIAAIALHEEFQFADERQKRFHDCFYQLYDDFKKLQMDDTGDNEHIGDPDYLYTIEAMERKLKESCGKYYCDRDKRYSVHMVYGGEDLGQVCFADEIKGRY